MLTLLGGCVTETAAELPTCELQVTAPAETVSTADSVTVVGRPFTNLLDTSVRFEGSEAPVTNVDREDCTLCDPCRESAGCTVCETCEACTASCETCIETVTFDVPELATGKYTVVFRNRYGLSTPADWDVVNPSDLDTGAHSE